jgi:stage II sporulation protein P
MPKFNVRFRWPKLYLPKAALKVCCVALSFLVVIGIGGATWRWYMTLDAPVSTSLGTRDRVIANIAGWMEPIWREAMFSGIPLLREITSTHVSVAIKKVNRPRSFFSAMSHFFANVDIRDPRTYLMAQIPLLSYWPLPTNANVSYIPNFPKLDPIDSFFSGDPLVAIYHTHTSEAYVPAFGKTHAPGGQKGDIVDVGEALAVYLQKDHGIKTVNNQAIHDYPSFMKAYAPSEITANKILQDHKSIQMLFDIHRDADKKENTTAIIGGEEVARIRIIVAIGQPDLPQPHWQQNHAFAKLIEAKMNEKYPGLSRGILLADWRYNQHLHPRALLLEVGAQDNTRDEAKRSMKMFASILAEIFRENQ